MFEHLSDRDLFVILFKCNRAESFGEDPEPGEAEVIRVVVEYELDRDRDYNIEQMDELINEYCAKTRASAQDLIDIASSDVHFEFFQREVIADAKSG